MKKVFMLSVLFCFLLSAFTPVKAFELKNEKEKIEKTFVDQKSNEITVVVLFDAVVLRNIEMPKAKLDVAKEPEPEPVPNYLNYNYCRNQYAMPHLQTIFKE